VTLASQRKHRNSADFLKLSGSDGVWSSLGGTGKAGQGVGVVDTGIWPESAAIPRRPTAARSPGPARARSYARRSPSRRGPLPEDSLVSSALFQLPEGSSSLLDADAFCFGNDFAEPTIDVVDAQPGTYVLAVISQAATDTSYSMQINVASADGGTGNLTLSPKKPQITPGTPVDLTLSWSSLTDAGVHTGYVEYPDGTGTVVSVN